MAFNFRKALISGIAGGIVLALIQILWLPVSGGVLSLLYPNMPPWSFQLNEAMVRLIAFNFTEGLIFAFVFAIIFSGIPGKGLMKGVNYALILFFINTLVGVGFAYIDSPFPLLFLASQLLIGLVQLLAMGAAVAITHEKV